MEFVVTQVEGSVDWLEGFEINIHTLFLSFIRDDSSAVNDKTIFGAFVVEFETLLGGCDSSENGKTVDT